LSQYYEIELDDYPTGNQKNISSYQPPARNVYGGNTPYRQPMNLEKKKEEQEREISI
jgi:hypothetical protein